MPAIDLLDPASLSPELVDVLIDAPMPGIFKGPAADGSGKAGARDAQEAAAAAEVCSRASLLVRRNYLGTLAEAGLWLLVDELERSHRVSQNMENYEGFFWHGIMHRREGDYSNAKYWFRRVGSHPVHTKLAAVIGEHASTLAEQLPLDVLTDAAKLPEALVDQCKLAARRGNLVQSLQQICWWEWQLLFSNCI